MQHVLFAQGTSRFDHPECNETRSWEQIAHAYKDSRSMLSTGSLGPLKTADFMVWVCFKGHPCLYKVLSGPSAGTDAMCYMYHETRQRWHAWALQSELQQCGHS